MKDSETISWIFLATAFASEQKPASFEEITQVADGINHAVPNHKELQTLLKWLAAVELIETQSRRYRLTTSGSKMIDTIEARSNNTILNIWNELTKEIEKRKRSTR